MSSSARHRRTKHGSQTPRERSSDHDHEQDDDEAKDYYRCRNNNHHHHNHNHHHYSDFWDHDLPMMMTTIIPRRIRRYYYYHPCNKVDLCAAGLCFIAVTLLLVEWMGLVSFLQTTFQDSSKLFLQDREFFDRPHTIPILVVGGTDGSGTRAFVSTLKQLGVLIVADDPRTFDVHAAIMFRKLGWPKLITTVLEATNGSLDYEWDTLPSNTRLILEREVRKLCYSLAAKYAENKRRMRLAETIRLRPHPGRTKITDPSMMLPTHPATGVAFAFKAPVAMLVLPLLTKFMGPIQFLHVVRDGRDIALSSNQSPVLKFYNATYPDYRNRTRQFQGDLYPVRGVQLWNDWNVQVYQWSQNTILKYNNENDNNTKNGNNDNNQARQQQEQQQLSGDEQSAASVRLAPPPPPFDYLVMRSEDLIDPSARFDCFQRLAKFVASPLSSHELCCLAQMEPEDFGQSTVHSESTNNFAAHPEEWQHMGSKAKVHDRSQWISFLHGGGSSHMNDDPDVDVDVPIMQGGNWNSKERYKYQQEIEALRAELAGKDRTIRFLETKLKQVASQHHHQDKDPPKDQPEQRKETGKQDLDLEFLANAKEEPPERRQRRHLLEKNKIYDQPHRPKVVPTMFLKHFSSWQEHIMTSGDELSLATLQKLLEFGGNLQRQYELNAPALKSVVEIKEIQDTCNYLKKLMQQQKKHQNPRPGLSKKERHGQGDQEEALAVHERYGKWKTKLENQPVLSEWLHGEGKVGLQLFGYEPRQDWNYTVIKETSSNGTARAFQCNPQVTCPRPNP